MQGVCNDPSMKVHIAQVPCRPLLIEGGHLPTAASEGRKVRLKKVSLKKTMLISCSSALGLHCRSSLRSKSFYGFVMTYHAALST